MSTHKYWNNKSHPQPLFKHHRINGTDYFFPKVGYSFPRFSCTLSLHEPYVSRHKYWNNKSKGTREHETCDKNTWHSNKIIDYMTHPNSPIVD
jgi:hypothetical protein